MLPNYFIKLRDTISTKDVAKKYFEDQYPQTDNCALLPIQIAGLKQDLEDINKRIASNQKEYEESEVSTFTLLAGNRAREQSKQIVEELIRRKTLLIELSCSNVVSPDELVNPESTTTAVNAEQDQSSTVVENTTSTTTDMLVKTTFVGKLKKMEVWKKGLIVLAIVGSSYLGYKLIKK